MNASDYPYSNIVAASMQANEPIVAHLLPIGMHDAEGVWRKRSAIVLCVDGKSAADLPVAMFDMGIVDVLENEQMSPVLADWRRFARDLSALTATRHLYPGA